MGNFIYISGARDITVEEGRGGVTSLGTRLIGIIVFYALNSAGRRPLACSKFTLPVPKACYPCIEQAIARGTPVREQAEDPVEMPLDNAPWMAKVKFRATAIGTRALTVHATFSHRRLPLLDVLSDSFGTNDQRIDI